MSESIEFTSVIGEVLFMCMADEVLHRRWPDGRWEVWIETNPDVGAGYWEKPYDDELDALELALKTYQEQHAISRFAYFGN